MAVIRCLLVAVVGVLPGSGLCLQAAESTVRLATFDVDATPPLQAQMAYKQVVRLDDLTLRCRGVVILGAGDPIVLCAIDWIGVGNEGHDAFREGLAEAAGTAFERVAVHAVHQHDAPVCDFTTERVLREWGVPGPTPVDGDFHRQVIARAAAAVRESLPNARRITHYGQGEAVVHEVASQRRILGPDGRVALSRWSTTIDPAIRAAAEGLIDPSVSLLSFWDGEDPVALLSYYACHPQSYYGTGVPSPDFPGIARFMRGQDVNAALSVHFNGAGGNVTAGKYNDGSQANRLILATRLAAGMREAFETTEKKPLGAADIGWQSVPVALPAAPPLDEEAFEAARWSRTAASTVAWQRWVDAGRRIDVSCLQVGDARVLHLPGELFVEYQLAAKAMRPDLHVMLAAYGQFGPGYIGTAASYSQGGYETGPMISRVSGGSERVLLDAMESLLGEPPASVAPGLVSPPAVRGPDAPER